LDGANLAGAILQGATLDEASLEGSAITVEQLEQVASYEAVKWPSHITELGVALVRARHGVHE
jgi:uncharacterized protein YjbI with pentapeptide repeats